MAYRLPLIALLGSVTLAAPANADVGFSLSAHVRELCGIERVSVSAGSRSSVVVQSQCNASGYRLTFVDLPQDVSIKAVQGNGESAVVSGATILVQPRRPGQQTAVVHFGRRVDAAVLRRVSLDVF